jgi:hypothetical protein
MLNSSNFIAETLNKPSSRVEGNQRLNCPSAQADWEGARVFGVVGGTVKEPRVSYLTEPQPVTKELLDLTSPVIPTEVLRIAAPCVESSCKHFDGMNCQLVSRTIAYLQPVAGKLPPCAVRSSCRWWHEQGGDACFRCPQVVTDSFTDNEQVILAATPEC